MNNVLLAVLGLSGGELVLVMVVILVLFGAKKIPEFAKGLGQGIKEFKRASNEVSGEIHRAMEEQPAPPTTALKTSSLPRRPSKYRRPFIGRTWLMSPTPGGRVALIPIRRNPNGFRLKARFLAEP
jgi:sec-independent protein translocase protein TatA